MLARIRSGRTIGLTVAGAVAGALLGVSVAAAADDVNVRFSWKMKGEYAHLYLAEEIGAFGERDLNVTLGEGAGSQAALGALVQGQEDVVVMPGIFALSAIQAGLPVKIIALHHPRAPMVMISHPENPVTEPQDLEGKKVAHAIGETGTSYLEVFCNVNQIDCSTIEVVTVAAQARVPLFIQGQVDVVSVYRSNDLPILEAEHDTEFPMLDLAEHGLAAPGMAIVASETGIRERADVLRRFLDALAEGIEAAKDDPRAAAEAIKANWDAGPDLEVIEAQVRATMEAIPDRGDQPIGWIDGEDIEAALELVRTEEGFGEPKPTEEYFTNELLN